MHKKGGKEMTIKNKIYEIKILQNQMLQDYFRMEIEGNFTEKEWREELLAVLDDDRRYRHSASLTGARRKIAEVGIANYTIGDMDSQLILTLFRGQNGFSDCCSCRLKWYLNDIIEDRNFEAHLNGNETDGEIFCWAIASIENLKKFVGGCSEWNTNSQVPKSERDAYCQKAYGALKEMSDQILVEYQEEFAPEPQLLEDSELNDIKDVYMKDKKKMKFPSIKFLQPVANVVNEAAEAINDKHRTAIPKVLGGTLGAGVGGVSSLSVLYNSGVVGLSAAGITSGLATSGAIIGGGMAAGVFVLALPVVGFAGVGISVAKSIINNQFKQEKE
jgi:hypothetical protein